MVRLFMSASKQLESSEMAWSRDDITFQFCFLDGVREMGKINTWVGREVIVWHICLLKLFVL